MTRSQKIPVMWAALIAIVIGGYWWGARDRDVNADRRGGDQGPTIAEWSKEQEAAIELVKRARTLDRGGIIVPGAPVRDLRTNEEEIRVQLENLKGDLQIFGWSAPVHVDADTWLVQYTILQDGRSRTWPFEANLRGQVVRYVLGDPVLEKKYGWSQASNKDSRLPADRTTGGADSAIAEPRPIPPLAPVPVGGPIKPPIKTKDVRPQYPLNAQSTRVQGVVIIEATIAADGKVQDARVLRSIPLLDAAALDAVRQWEFTPTLVNGVPVPVIMTVTVQFKIS